MSQFDDIGISQDKDAINGGNNSEDDVMKET